MLGFRKSKADAVTGFLGSQTEFTGKLCFAGVVHLDGTFHGEIISRGTLVVGSESVVHAEIHSNVLKVSGEVHGNLTATEKIELYPPAKVYGNIRTPSLVVEEGVIFEGTCKMTSVPGEKPLMAEPLAQESPEEDEAEEISAEAWHADFEQGEIPVERLDEESPYHKHR
jgi:cytoskeletal protein CcmA (bactofilin family)